MQKKRNSKSRSSSSIRSPKSKSAKTTRKKAVKVEEKAHGILFNSSHDAIYMIQDNKLVQVNPAWEKLLGYSLEEVTQPSFDFLSIIHPDYRSVVIKRLENFSKGIPNPEKYFIKALRKDGTSVDLEVFSTNVVWDNKPSVIGIYRDITFELVSEIALKESEEKYRKLFEDSPFGIAYVDSKGRYINANEAYLRILSISPDELPKQSLLNTIHPEDVNEIKRILSELISGLINQKQVQNRHYLTNRTIIWTQTTFSASKTSDGKFDNIVVILSDITEQKKAEQNLSDQERYFRKLIENSHDMIFNLSKEGIIRFCSASVKKVLGFEPDYLTGKKIFDLVNPPDKQHVISSLKEILLIPGLSKSFTVKFNNNSGDWRFLECAAYNLINDPLVEGIIINTRDVTGRKKAEDALIESEERFRQLAENISGVSYAVDALQSTISYISPVYSRLFGIEIHTNISFHDNWILNIYPADRDFVSEHIKNLNKLHSYDIEYRFIRADFRIRWVRDRIYPVFNDKGIIYRYTGIIEDITEDKAREEQIRQLSYAVHQSPAIVMITDPTGKIQYVNPKFTQITGYEPEEVIGKNPNILKSGFTSKEEYNVLWKTLKSGGEWYGEFYNKKKNGDYYWESAMISPLKDRNGDLTHFVAIKEDITIRKYQEEQLLAAKEKAEKSDRLKSEFLAQMSHEIRTPLNNIMTYTSLLKEEVEDKLPQGLESVFRVIDSSSRRLLNTIDLILNLSKIQTGNYDTKYEVIDLGEDILSNMILEFYSSASAKGLTIDYKDEADHRMIEGDNYSVSQIFVNLISNAIKYSHKGKITLRIYNEDNFILADVSDEGIGISEEFLPNLFEPFTQEDSSTTRGYEGTGLGLTLVKKYAEINNAEISVRSVKGEGTTFTVKFNPAQTGS